MKKFSILSLTIFVASILLCISFANLLSTALLSTSLFANTNAVSGEKQTVYAISMAKAQNKDDFQPKICDLQSQNGAGYIFEKDETFFLIASVYANKSDAEKVKNNLKSSGTDSEILQIDLPYTKIEGNFSNDERNILLASLNSNYTTFSSLYDVAISLDTKIFDKTKAKLECNSIFSKHISTKTNFQTFFAKEMDEELFENLDKKLQKIENFLSILTIENFETTNQTFSSLIKLTYCKILFET